jgi:hypothetical protein
MVEASINGVSGSFIIDTGSPNSFLFVPTIDRCKIACSSFHGQALGVEGKVELLEATNVTVNFASGFKIHWSSVPVLPANSQVNSDFLGLIGYSTLAGRNAVLDLKHKTITLMK